MKTIKYFAFLLLFVFAYAGDQHVDETTKTSGSGIKWISYEEMIKLQKEKPKKVVVDVYTDWCGWCKVMDKKTFSNAEIGKYVNKNFYAVKLNAESADKVLYKGEVISSAELAGRVWQVSGYPTTVYLNENLDLLTQPVSGFLDSAQFNKIVHFFGENAYKKQTFDNYVVGK
ncbi:MAG TPA: DUF255 domain-containing protein [Cytophagales bacterium]|nr:DUF255 domain-containing protein [Cytophagales bacterium]